jgi:hypothetical protein
MRPDLFITIAFGSLVVVFGLAGLFVARHERRRDHAAERDGRRGEPKESALRGNASRASAREPRTR